MLWLGVAYLLALGALFVTSLWSQNDFTGAIERIWTLDNYRQIWEIPVYRTIAVRTIALARSSPWWTPWSPSRSRSTWRSSPHPAGDDSS